MLLHLDASRAPSQTKSDSKGRGSIAFRVLALDLLESRKVQAHDKIRKMQDSRIGMSTTQELDVSELESTRQPIQVEFLSPDQAPPDTCHAVLEVRLSTPPLLYTTPHPPTSHLLILIRR
jgi:hypothetical protein